MESKKKYIKKKGVQNRPEWSIPVKFVSLFWLLWQCFNQVNWIFPFYIPYERIERLLLVSLNKISTFRYNSVVILIFIFL